MLKPGLSVSVRYGAEIELVDIGTLKLVEPVAGFQVSPNPSYGRWPEEFWIGIDPTKDRLFTHDTEDSPAWIIRPPSFRGSGVDLVLVGSDYFDAVATDPHATIPPGVRLEFTVRSRRLAWGDQIIHWLGNGCDFEFCGDLYTLREDESVQMDIPGKPQLMVRCENIRGRGRVELRLHIDPSVQIIRK